MEKLSERAIMPAAPKGASWVAPTAPWYCPRGFLYSLHAYTRSHRLLNITPTPCLNIRRLFSSNSSAQLRHDIDILCTSSFVRPSGRDLFGSGSLALPASALSKVGFLQSALSLLHWPCGDCLANEKSLTDLQNRLDLFLLIKRLGFSGCSQATRFFFSNSINRNLWRDFLNFPYFSRLTAS